MLDNTAIKKTFNDEKEKLFSSELNINNSLGFSLNYSFIVDEQITKLCKGEKFKFALCAAGSYCRRELSPFSDIDLIFISYSVEEDENEIKNLITRLWDAGIEVSHTVREFSDIEKFLKNDLHSFTQFFETRFLLGSKKLFNEWTKKFLSVLNNETKIKLISELFEDTSERHNKYGDSPKVLEPNVKLSAGGLRDFQTVEWIYVVNFGKVIEHPSDITQTEFFIKNIVEKELTSKEESERLLNAYKTIMYVRNFLHISSKHKNDRFEFNSQNEIAAANFYDENSLSLFMKKYFEASNIIYRFTKSYLRKITDETINPMPDQLTIELDDNYKIIGKKIFITNSEELSMSDILRGFYYRGLYDGYFDEQLRSLIIYSIEKMEGNSSLLSESSVFFREILNLPRNVGTTLSVMNELGVLSAFLPEWKDLVGFLQHGVYHCYTADEHTLITIQNVEKLESNKHELGKIFRSIKEKDILYLGLLFHDIAKAISIAGHEIIGSEIATSVLQRLGYLDDQIENVTFLVKNHLHMEQVAFRRNLNDPETLNSFVENINSLEKLDLLYLVTYADLSAVNPAVWTSWKSDLLSELYRKSKSMIQEQISGEDLLRSSTYIIPKEISKLSNIISESNVKEHIESINDIGYAHQFTDEEIAKHVEEIQKGNLVSVLFKEYSDFTNVTVITKDFSSLLSKLCGVLSINDANIHDAKIFTRKDGIVIDTFNVTDFRSHKPINRERYDKIIKDLESVISGNLQLNIEFKKMRSRWWRIENKFFKRSGKIKIVFENHEKYTIIDVFSPDRLGFLYQVTNKMNELGLSIYFAKIATKGDDIVDAFYTLNRNGKKINRNDYDFIKSELTETINQLL